MAYLSEKKIKRATLSFFKAYYKFRPRIAGDTIARMDVQKGTLIADGLYSFPISKNESFIATFEATSFDTQDEVCFQIQTKNVHWDGAALASLITAFFYSWGYASDHFTIDQIGWFRVVCLLLGVFLLSFVTFRFIVKNLTRYRYIYAIEQFKKYHADEQWIAIGDDVFNGLSQRYLKELKNQCVLNGFGLIEIDQNLDSHLLITPSRQEVFGQQRDNVGLLNRDESAKRNKRNKAKDFANKIFTKVRKLTGDKRAGDSLQRFRRSNIKQIILITLSLLIVSGVFYKEYENRDIIYVDEKDYQQVLSQKADKLDGDYTDYLLDTAHVRRYNESTSSYLDIAEAENLEGQNRRTLKRYEIIETEMLELDAYPDDDQLMTVSNDAENPNDLGGYGIPDCERFHNFTGAIYLVQDNTFQSLESARRRVNTLEARNITANSIWLGCFNTNQDSYAVYYDLMYDNISQAQQAANQYEKLLKRKKIRIGSIKLRALTK